MTGGDLQYWLHEFIAKHDALNKRVRVAARDGEAHLFVELEDEVGAEIVVNLEQMTCTK